MKRNELVCAAVVAAMVAAGTVDTRAEDLVPLGDILSVATGGGHSCALTAKGAVKCWGGNQFGQLGDGSTERRSMPVDVVGLQGGIAAITAGQNHSCAVTTSGGIKCWGWAGRTFSGQYSVDHWNPRPVALPGLSSVVAISAREHLTCALTSAGGVTCWGVDGTLFEMEGLQQDIASIAASSTSVCGLTRDGVAKCERGFVIPGLAAGNLAIAFGEHHNCVLTATRGVKCTGLNYDGQLGDGTLVERRTYVDVNGLESGIASIAAGYSHTCALTASGAVKCWGGDGGPRPIDVQGLEEGATAISAAWGHTCAVMRHGQLRCWGANGYGQLGDNYRQTASAPEYVVGLQSGIRAIAAGGYGSTCALDASGRIACWGEGYGITPKLVAAMEDVRAVSVGHGYACALTTGGGVKCWGDNSIDQLGNNSTTSSAVPVEVMGLTIGVSALAVGAGQSCAIVSGGAVKCWGVRSGSDLSRHLTPTEMPGLGSGAVSIANLGSHACAVLASGAVKCWGQNAHGQLGIGSARDAVLPPAAVSELGAPIRAVAVGWEHTCALTLAGAVKCWGNNLRGQLGDGTGETRYAPVDVRGLPPGVVSISAGRDHTCAVTNAAQLWCWGHVIGTAQATPAFIPGAVRISAVAAGERYTCLLKDYGAVQCFGYNPDGHLGNGTAGARSNPAPVLVPARQAPSVSGLWGNPSEPGWGIHFVERGGVVFATLYTYDASGSPKWHVASHCALPAGMRFTGTCDDSLYETGGSAFFERPFDPKAIRAKAVGSLRLTFSDADHASLSYTVAGQSRTVELTRHVFAVSGSRSVVDYTGLWWNPDESGWGLAVTHQFDVLFLAWYVYDASGQPVWYVAPRCSTGVECGLYRTTGSSLGPSFDASLVRTSQVGSVTFAIEGEDTATIRYTVNGVSAGKEIVRMRF